MQDVLQMMSSWGELATAYVFGLGMPPIAIHIAPFLLPVVIVLFSRRVMAVLAVAAIAALAVVASLGMIVDPQWLQLIFLGCFVVALLIAFDAWMLARAYRHTMTRLVEITPEYSLALAALDRERLWRRAGGHTDPYVDAEVLGLAERVLQAKAGSKAIVVPIPSGDMSQKADTVIAKAI